MVEIKKNLVDEKKYNIKCPYEMEAEFVIVHNTFNDAPAENEIKYMISNNNTVSFHYAVDDKEIVQGIPTNRNSWNAGDGGSGKGNRKGIAIEICYSKSGGERFIQAEKNTAEFIASILKEKGWGIDRVKRHKDFSGKYCPHRTMDIGWDRFLNMIKSHLEETPTHKYKIGDNVIFSTCYVSSTAPNNEAIPVEKMNTNHGTITRIVEAKNPYLLNNGLCWVNDGDIRGYYTDKANSNATKDLNAVVDAVIRGDYGNNPERKSRLEADGYDPNEIQRLVNKRYGV